jgi:AmmeMemoRadiSam system protein B
VIVRRPAVAGSFYPAQADQLRQDVVKLLADAGTAVNIAPKALIAPHAGYIYSGSTAAAAFATLHDSRQTLKRIVLIGRLITLLSEALRFLPLTSSKLRSGACRSTALA